MVNYIFFLDIRSFVLNYHLSKKLKLIRRDKFNQYFNTRVSSDFFLIDEV
jgi:hypothetical protein